MRSIRSIGLTIPLDRIRRSFSFAQIKSTSQYLKVYLTVSDSHALSQKFDFLGHPKYTFWSGVPWQGSKIISRWSPGNSRDMFVGMFCDNCLRFWNTYADFLQIHSLNFEYPVMTNVSILTSFSTSVIIPISLASNLRFTFNSNRSTFEHRLNKREKSGRIDLLKSFCQSISPNWNFFL